MKIKSVEPETVYVVFDMKHLFVAIAPKAIGFPEQAVLPYSLSKLRIVKSIRWRQIQTDSL